MAKNVIINGVTYSDVPYVNIPLASGDGNAKFVDTDSGNAVASDIRNGVIAWVDGNEVVGNVSENTSDSVTINGRTVTIPAGVYDEQVQKSVASGVVTPNVVISGDVVGDTESDYMVEVTPKATVDTVGYINTISDGEKVKKYIQVESKSVSPTTAQQIINPTSGKLLQSVTVAGVNVDATATESDVLNGKTFYSGSLTMKTGTATVPTVGQDSSTKVLTIS